MPTRPIAINTRIGERLAQTIGRRRYELWIEPSVRWDYDAAQRTLQVSVANRFVADKLRAEFCEDLRAAACAELGPADADLKLDVCIAPDRFTSPPAPGSSAAADAPTHSLADGETQAAPGPDYPGRDTALAAAGAQRSGPFGRGEGGATLRRPQRSSRAHVTSGLETPLRYRFEDFVVGSCNELAFAAAQALAERPWQDASTDPDTQPTAENHPLHNAGPLFIHGRCGLGKTHLLQATCQRVLQQHPEARVLYTTAEQFANAFITAVRDNQLGRFRKTLRRLDLLAIDDVGFLAGKEKTQLEFLHCFNHLELAGSRIVIASDNHPKLIRQFSDGLVSRCVQGMVVQMHAPDPATRKALVQRLAQRRGLMLAPLVDELLAAQAGPSVRELEGTMAQLSMLACLEQPQGPTRLVTRTLVDRLLGGQRSSRPARPLRFEEIQDAVCSHLQVPAAQVLGSSRHRQVVLARALTIYLTRELMTLSFPEVAAALGRNSHSTVVTADHRLRRQLLAAEPLLLPGRAAVTDLPTLVEEIKAALLAQQGSGHSR